MPYQHRGIPGEDTESFDSLKSFKDDHTKSAVKHFDSIDISVGEPASRVTIAFVKRGPAFARRGAPSSEARDQATGALLALRKAIHRGSPTAAGFS